MRSRSAVSDDGSLRPQSEGSVGVERPFSKASSRALISRQNTRFRDAIKSVKIMVANHQIDYALLSSALQELCSSSDVLLRNFSHINDLTFLGAISHLIQPSEDQSLISMAVGFLQILMGWSDQSSEVSKNVAQKSTTIGDLKALFGTELHGLEHLLSFLSNCQGGDASSPIILKDILDLLMAALKGHDGNQRRAVALGYVERLTDMVHASALAVSVRGLALRSLAVLVGPAAIDHLLRGSALHAAADALRGPNATLKREAAALFRAVANLKHPHADRRLEDLRLGPHLLHTLLHEHIPAVRCAAAATLTALLDADRCPSSAQAARHPDLPGHTHPPQHHGREDVLLNRLSAVAAALQPLVRTVAAGDSDTRAAALGLLAACVRAALSASARPPVPSHAPHGLHPGPAPGPAPADPDSPSVPALGSESEPRSPSHSEVGAEGPGPAAPAGAETPARAAERPLDVRRRHAAREVLRGLVAGLAAARDDLAAPLVEFLSSPAAPAGDAAVDLLAALAAAAGEKRYSQTGTGRDESAGADSDGPDPAWRDAVDALAGRRCVVWALAALAAADPETDGPGGLRPASRERAADCLRLLCALSPAAAAAAEEVGAWTRNSRKARAGVAVGDGDGGEGDEGSLGHVFAAVRTGPEDGPTLLPVGPGPGPAGDMKDYAASAPASAPASLRRDDVVDWCLRVGADAPRAGPEPPAEEVDRGLRLEGLLWLRGILRADPTARARVRAAGLVSHVARCLDGLADRRPLRVLCAALDTCADACSGLPYASDSGEGARRDEEMQAEVAGRALSQLLRELRRLLAVDLAGSAAGGGAMRLLRSCGGLLLSSLYRNTPARAVATRLGVLTLADELTRAPAADCQRLGFDLVAVVCDVLPALAELAFRVRSESDRPARAFDAASLAHGTREDGPACGAAALGNRPLPPLVAAALQALSGCRPLQPSAHAARPGAGRRRSSSSEPAGLGDPEARTLSDAPLVVAAGMRALAALCGVLRGGKLGDPDAGSWRACVLNSVMEGVIPHLHHREGSNGLRETALRVAMECGLNSQDPLRSERLRNEAIDAAATILHHNHDNATMLSAREARGLAVLEAACLIVSEPDPKNSLTEEPNVVGPQLGRACGSLIDLFRYADEDALPELQTATAILVMANSEVVLHFLKDGGLAVLQVMIKAGNHFCTETKTRQLLSLVGLETFGKLLLYPAYVDICVTSDKIEDMHTGKAILQSSLEILQVCAHADVADLLEMLSSAENSQRICLVTVAMSAFAAVIEYWQDLLDDAIHALTYLLTSPESKVIASAARCIHYLVICGREFQVGIRIKATGALPCMLALLSCPDTETQHALLNCLDALCQIPQVRKVVVQNGGIESTIRLINCTRGHRLKAAAAGHLASLIFSASGCKVFLHNHGMDILIDCLGDSVPDVVEQAAFSLQRILSNRDTHGSVCWSLALSKFCELDGICKLKSSLAPQKHAIAVVRCLELFRVLCSKPVLHRDLEAIKWIQGIHSILIHTDIVAAQGTALVCLCAIYVKLECSTPCVVGEANRDIKEFLRDQISELSTSEDSETLTYFSKCIAVLGTDLKVAEISNVDFVVPLLFRILQEQPVTCQVEAAKALESVLEGIQISPSADLSLWTQNYNFRSLFELLLLKNETASGQAARTLSAFAKAFSAAEAMWAPIPDVKEEGVAIFLDVMGRSTFAETQIACLHALQAISNHSLRAISVGKIALTSLVQDLNSEHTEVVFAACECLHVLGKAEDNLERMMQAGACPILCGLLQDFSLDIQRISLKIIQNMSKNTRCRNSLLKFGALNLLLHTIDSSAASYQVIVSALEAVQCFVCSQECQDCFLSASGIDIIERILNSRQCEVLNQAIKVLIALAKHAGTKDAVLASSAILNKLQSLMLENSETILSLSCDFFSACAGNTLHFNDRYRKILEDAGVGATCISLLNNTSITVKYSCIKALMHLNSPGIRDKLLDLDIFSVLNNMLSIQKPRYVVIVANFVSSLVRFDDRFRKACVHQGVLEQLCFILRLFSFNNDSRPDCQKMTLRAKASAAEAVASIVECFHCRRCYLDHPGSVLDLDGNALDLPSISSCLVCPDFAICSSIAECISNTGLGEALMDLLRSTDAKAQTQAALAIAACCIGAPIMGSCRYSKHLCILCLENDALTHLAQMLRSSEIRTEAASSSSSAFAACKALSSLCIHPTIANACCSFEILHSLSLILRGSTYGKLRGAASSALARMSCSGYAYQAESQSSSESESVFYWQSQSGRVSWSVPDELQFYLNTRGERVAYGTDEVAYDAQRSGFWVRGVLKPYEKVPRTELLSACFEVKTGASSVQRRLKADREITVTCDGGLVADMLDVFESDSSLAGQSEAGWPLEALALLAIHPKHRAYVAAWPGCIARTIRLLSSQSPRWSELAAILLSALLLEPAARDIAGAGGAAEAICDVLSRPDSDVGRRESAALALARLCSGASNQVVALRAGVVMPIVRSLSSARTPCWCCAADALCSLAANDECKRAIGAAGGVPALVARVELGQPVAGLVRVLGGLCRLAAVEDNCDQAVNSGILRRLMAVAEPKDGELLVLEYSSQLFKILARADRHLFQLVQFGLIRIIVGLCRRCEIDPKAASSRALPASLAYILAGLAGREAFRQPLVDGGALPALRPLLQSSDPVATLQACVTLAQLASRDAWQKEARAAGLLPTLASLVRSRSTPVRMEAATAIRAVAAGPGNREALVASGCLHGLRDMMDLGSRDAAARAAAALHALARHAPSAEALAVAGAIRPLVRLTGGPDVPAQYDAAAALRLVAKLRGAGRDTRSEMADCGAAQQLAHALEGRAAATAVAAAVGDTSAMGGRLAGAAAAELAGWCAAMTRSEMLDAGAEGVVAGRRAGLVHADATARRVRAEMGAGGIAGKLVRLQEVAGQRGGTEGRRIAAACRGGLEALRGEADLG